MSSKKKGSTRQAANAEYRKHTSTRAERTRVKVTAHNKAMKAYMTQLMKDRQAQKA